jgi:hypothetical protein
MVNCSIYKIINNSANRLNDNGCKIHAKWMKIINVRSKTNRTFRNKKGNIWKAILMKQTVKTKLTFAWGTKENHNKHAWWQLASSPRFKPGTSQIQALLLEQTCSMLYEEKCKKGC